MSFAAFALAAASALPSAFVFSPFRALFSFSIFFFFLFLFLVLVIMLVTKSEFTDDEDFLVTDPVLLVDSLSPPGPLLSPSEPGALPDTLDRTESVPLFWLS